MHIVMMLIGALAAIGAIIWRIQMAAQAARQMGDVAKTAANLPRRLAFRHKSGKKGSRLVEDPREAAVILMLEVARAAGEISREQKNEINSIICEHFEFSEGDAEEIIAQASWVSQDEAGNDAMHRRLSNLIVKAVNNKDLVDLDDMLVRVSEVEGQPNQDQLAVLSTFRNVAGLKV